MALSNKEKFFQSFTKFLTGDIQLCESLYDVLPVIVGFAAYVNGLAVAWPSTVLIKFRRHATDYYLTPKQRSWGVSCGYLSQLLVVVPTAIMQERFGKRILFLTISSFHMVTWTIICYVRSQKGFIGAQVLTGINFGFYALNGPTYLSELTNPKKRGRSASTLAAFFVMGTITETLIGAFNDYQTQAFLSGSIAAALYPFLFAVPESPYFLIRAGRVNDAIYEMGRMRGVKLKEDEVTAIMHVSLGQKLSYCDMFIDPTLRYSIFRGLLLTFIQRGSSYGPLLVYPAQLLPASFVGPNVIPPLLNFCILVGIFISGGLVDLFGRKSFMIVSTLGTLIFQIVLCWWFWQNEYDLYDNRSPQLPLLLFMIHNFMYGIGLFWIPALVTNELLPVRVRAKALSIILFFGNSCSLFYIKLFISLWKTIGVYMNFMLYIVATGVGFMYSWFMLETKNKTLDQIQQQLAKRRQQVMSSAATLVSEDQRDSSSSSEEFQPRSSWERQASQPWPYQKP